MDSPSFLRPACFLLSALAIVAGGLGMAMSLLEMTSSNIGEITAGASGFVAGSVLVGAGVVSLTLLATRSARGGPHDKPSDRSQEWT